MPTLRSLTRRGHKVISRHGLIGAIRLGLKSLIHRDVPNREAHLAFDRAHGVDTAGVIHLSKLTDITSPNWIYGCRYQPIGEIDLGAALEGLDVDYGRTVFIDLGAGKGKALLLAALLPFPKLIGVEFSPKLAEIARANLQVYRNAGRLQAATEVVCQDAAEYDFPPEPAVLFIYNPFERAVMERVTKNVARSLQKHPRPLVVLYWTPDCADLWDAVDGLKLVRENAGLRVYASGTGNLELGATKSITTPSRGLDPIEAAIPEQPESPG